MKNKKLILFTLLFFAILTVLFFTFRYIIIKNHFYAAGSYIQTNFKKHDEIYVEPDPDISYDPSPPIRTFTLDYKIPEYIDENDKFVPIELFYGDMDKWKNIKFSIYNEESGKENSKSLIRTFAHCPYNVDQENGDVTYSFSKIVTFPTSLLIGDNGKLIISKKDEMFGVSLYYQKIDEKIKFSISDPIKDYIESDFKKVDQSQIASIDYHLPHSVDISTKFKSISITFFYGIYGTEVPANAKITMFDIKNPQRIIELSAINANEKRDYSYQVDPETNIVTYANKQGYVLTLSYPPNIFDKEEGVIVVSFLDSCDFIFYKKQDEKIIFNEYIKS